MSFRLDYKRGSASGTSTPTSMFQRQVKMQVDISHISKAESGPEALYAITFTLLSGENHDSLRYRIFILLKELYWYHSKNLVTTQYLLF